MLRTLTWFQFRLGHTKPKNGRAKTKIQFELDEKRTNQTTFEGPN